MQHKIEPSPPRQYRPAPTTKVIHHFYITYTTIYNIYKKTESTMGENKILEFTE